ncbi:hypothetical protein [Paenibacillus sp. NFR01]|uniref:hypothetical protein n=1 Tax=Paenibacillus sp. NFR01 TaxID=1566279 RepID=UPI0008B54E9C|nr:hypothetical protein [Paenibacillus sp. NFR01]SEU02062.1 hypothetical protein SAMN03159358_3126 [Paenibacillus sp. NFR01]
MDTLIYAVIAVLYLLLLIYGFALWKREDRHGPRYLLFLLTAALVWDNGIMALGTTLDEGELLKGLNVVRFWLHAFCTPLLAWISLDLIRQAGSPWAQKPLAGWMFVLYTAALILLELAKQTLSLVLEPVREYGALRYVPAEEASGPPLMFILVMIPLFAAGIILWKRKVTPVLFWGSLLMIAGSLIPFDLESSAITNIFELLLIGSIWMAISRLANRRTGLSYR